MQRAVRATGGWRQWTGRILPAFCIALLATAAVHAKDSEKKDPPQRDDAARKDPPPKAAEKGISMERAKDQVEKSHHAKVVRARKGESGGRPAYIFRLLSDDGHVWEVRVDAETGKEL